MNIYILLTTPLTDAGPFNIYSDVGGFVSPIAINVSKSTLLSGYSTSAPDGTSIVRLVSIGECTNYIDFAVGGGPVPSTTSTTSTTANPYELYWYYGLYNSPGGVVPIPTEVDINVLDGTLVTATNPSGTLLIPFNSATDDFLWFAIPVSAGTKSNWYVTDLNQGSIGGPATYFGNLFPDPVVVNYNGVDLNLYISTGRTNVAQMIIT